MAGDWSKEELVSAVNAYLKMARLESLQKGYSKKEIYRDLASRFGRTEKAFEYRMQNISAVLDGMGKAYIPGLKPAGNVGANVKARIIELLQRSGSSTRPSATRAAYKAKLPAIRDWLIQVARHEERVTYGDVMTVFGVDRHSLRHGMEYLGRQADDWGEPIITALIVNKASRRCSIGLEKAFGIQDDEAERHRLYKFWQRIESPISTPDLQADLEVRAARFASVEVRPTQAAFRRRVFIAFCGRCAISGCDVDKALDAAHLLGRDWRRGHNGPEDGILLRKDLHALYDSNLLKIHDGFRVECALEHYRHFDGSAVAVRIEA